MMLSPTCTIITVLLLLAKFLMDSITTKRVVSLHTMRYLHMLGNKEGSTHSDPCFRGGSIVIKELHKLR